MDQDFDGIIIQHMHLISNEISL